MSLYALSFPHVEMFDWERESKEHLEVEQQIFWCEEFGDLTRESLATIHIFQEGAILTTNQSL